MAPPASTQTLLSPAELSFIHSSLSLTPPIRPDLRTPTQFRPLIAETDILATTNGSARICFSDGTEAIVGVKAEVEKTGRTVRGAGTIGVERSGSDGKKGNDEGADVHMTSSSGSESEDEVDAPHETQGKKKSRHSDTTISSVSDAWLELSIELPGHRDDDPLPVFLSSMLTETLLASGSLKEKLYVNARWHWKLYIDILLLSPPLSYPLPLLSLTVHLALLDAKLPRLTSEKDDDPMFDDDWDAAVPLYTRSIARPPVTLLVMTVGENVIFDPSREELAVAECVMAISVAPTPPARSKPDTARPPYKLLAIRTIDPPSRLTPPGVPNALNPASAVPTSGAASSGQTASETGNSVAGAPTNAAQEVLMEKEKGNLWSPPRGGVKRGLIAKVVKMVVGRGGVAGEVLDGLASVET